MKFFLTILLLGSVFTSMAYGNACPSNNKYAKKPDGCSSLSNNPKQFRDKWGPVNFRPSCMAHDRCYYNLNSTESSCNNKFLDNLKTACRNDLRICRTVLGRKLCTPPAPASYNACAAFSTGIYTFVRGAAGYPLNIYKKAQKAQRKHEQQCAARKKQKSQCASKPNIEVRIGTSHKVWGKGKSWKTCSGYRTIFQGDGNLVVYNPAGKAVWASNTNGKGGAKLVMQTDGNLVIYTSGWKPVWSSNTNKNTGAFLAVQQDGNVVIYKSNGRALWATGTRGK